LPKTSWIASDARFRRGEIAAGPRGPSSGAAEYFRKLRSLLRFLRMRDLKQVPDRKAPLAQPRLFLSERNLAHGAGMTLQFVRPDIRQSCILLAAVKS
jgi:hypothetical protein